MAFQPAYYPGDEIEGGGGVSNLQVGGYLPEWLRDRVMGFGHIITRGRLGEGATFMVGLIALVALGLFVFKRYRWRSQA